MDIKSLYREIVNEHNLHPSHKHNIDHPTMVLNGVNPSCGDDIDLQLVVKDGIVEDAAFNGYGCAVSQASTDMMCDVIIGKTEAEAARLADLFMGMIRGDKLTEEEKEELDEAASLEDVSHMPARVKCATLGWRTAKEMIDKLQADGTLNGKSTGSNADSCGACTIPGQEQ